jgi:hypothetical protein
LVAVQALANCNVDASLHIGSLLCRVGPDPRRDVVAFCGPGNAGYGQLFHAWAEVDDHMLDFSVGDWRRLDGIIPLGRGFAPIQWATTLPEYWCKPRSAVVDPWPGARHPALGEPGTASITATWPSRPGRSAVIDEIMPRLAGAVRRWSQ